MQETNKPSIDDVFLAALQLPRQKQSAYLDEVCEGNDEFRGRVQRLLNAQSEVGSFLDSPAPELDATCLQPVTEQPGTLIGSYKLLQKIGEGGMGVVYMAEQEQPVRRKVALKIIKPGMDSSQVVARFEAERQAMAMMEHNNIAKVYEAGTTERGRPYFVMELVHGVPITDYCDANQLTAEERLSLFIPVCQAIHHAHQKGIIHRDIKPSNVLVTMYDDKPMPKVIDFGVAKALQQRLTEKTLFTEYGSLVGTFEYMSPEQAELNAFGVDTRSDVYSLGVLLFELLTGTTPLQRERIRGAAYGEIVRLIKEEESPRPSVRLSTSGELAKVAAARNTDPAKLSSVIKGELDWIVMRCLEKDRSRRYDGASTLAKDVERYLAGDAVEACPPSLGYSLQKFARRNRASVIVGASIMVAVLLGLVGTSIGMFRAFAAEADANEAREIADEKTQTVITRNEELARATAKAEEATELAREQARTINRNLYAANMTLASHLVSTPPETNLVRHLVELTDPWIPAAGDLDLRGWDWYYLRAQLHQDERTINFPENAQSVVMTDDWKVLATNHGTMIRLWSCDTMRELGSWTAPDGNIRNLAWHPDGKRLAFTLEGETQSILVWDVQKEESPKPYKEMSAAINAIVWSPEGSRLAVATDESLVIVNTEDGHVNSIDFKFPTRGFKNWTSAISWSPDGTQLAIKEIGGERVRFGPASGPVTILDAVSGSRVSSFDIDGFSICWSPSGKFLAGFSFEGNLGIWDIDSGEKRHLIDVNGASFGLGLIAWSPDETRIAAVGSGKPRIVICDVEPGGRIQEFVGHSDNIGWLSWSHDGERIASSSRDRTIKQWSLAKNANHPKRYPMPRSAWSPDPHHPILASGHQRNGMITVWDVERDQFMYEFQGSENLRHVTFSPDGRYLASSTRDFNDATRNYPRAAIGIWDLKTGRQTALIPVEGNAVYWTEWSPDGRYLAAAVLEGMRKDEERFGEIIVKVARVELWDVSNLETWEDSSSRPDKTLPVPQMYPRTLAWSSDGKNLAVGHGFNDGKGDGSIHIWTIETNEVKMLHGHKSSVMEIAWSPDDKSLFSCSREPRGQSTAGNECIVWDVESLQEKFRLKGHLSSGVLCVDWSPDGKRLVSGARDNSIRIWDSETGNLVSTLLGHESFVSSVQWNHDGTILASSEAFGRTIFWDATKGYALDKARAGEPVSQE